MRWEEEKREFLEQSTSAVSDQKAEHDETGQ
jgi:hypothetical protein